ncbi:MAG: hypothetical protein A3I61_17325 [Acidobacteria bacterium RIFCSPLOWO2_02_FULL_68_18]|nr:MAG: hypothetical protein A3I61_17325 [Acidobacteria bacterium RIFCSPLOWO2_02_FULL_68_18]OFW50441.1 MAG: hypothetical protein A3G77_11900 [Acidobacteria bacterium RIFCSPLOWO2_12_FULL_68_19]
MGLAVGAQARPDPASKSGEILIGQARDFARGTARRFRRGDQLGREADAPRFVDEHAVDDAQHRGK